MKTKQPVDSVTGISSRRRYAAVGTGGRVPMFIDPIAGPFAAHVELVGLCDPSETRRSYHQARLAAKYGIGLVPTYSDFGKMLQQQRPDSVIICTPDYLHDEYIVRSLEFGCDVITEKPLTTNEVKCRRILDAVERTGQSVRVTFNMRWMPSATKVKEIISTGTIGNVKSVVLEYMLSTSHGGDYFRRWHSEKAKSGGLLVHKSTHHFDLVNWFVDSIPESVVAFGDLAYYGKENAVSRGEEKYTLYDRYADQAPDSDPFKIDMAGDATMKALYLDAEKDSGYIRDRNVFREGIDIEDSIGVLVKYRNRAMLTYSLTAFCPREGFRAMINGDKGRIEYTVYFDTQVIHTENGAGGGAVEPEESQKVVLMSLFGPARPIELPKMEGDHGGGDQLLQERLFGNKPFSDSWGRDAGHEQGAASALIGFAANQSLKTGLPVKVSSLLSLKPGVTRLSDLI